MSSSADFQIRLKHEWNLAVVVVWILEHERLLLCGDSSLAISTSNFSKGQLMSFRFSVIHRNQRVLNVPWSDGVCFKLFCIVLFFQRHSNLFPKSPKSPIFLVLLVPQQIPFFALTVSSKMIKIFLFTFFQLFLQFLLWWLLVSLTLLILYHFLH